MQDSNENQKENQKEITFGEMLFNPSNEEKVGKANKLFAELANLLNDHHNVSQSQFSSKLFDHAVGEILNAQMNVVNFLTLKY